MSVRWDAVVDKSRFWTEPSRPFPVRNGWQGPLARQRLHRTAVEERQVRACVSSRLRERCRGKATAGGVFHFLQQPAAAFVAQCQDAGHGILRRPAHRTGRVMIRLSTAPLASGHIGAGGGVVDNRKSQVIHLSSPNFCPNRRGHFSSRNDGERYFRLEFLPSRTTC